MRLGAGACDFDGQNEDSARNAGEIEAHPRRLFAGLELSMTCHAEALLRKREAEGS